VISLLIILILHYRNLFIILIILFSYSFAGIHIFFDAFLNTNTFLIQNIRLFLNLLTIRAHLTPRKRSNLINKIRVFQNIFFWNCFFLFTFFTASLHNILLCDIFHFLLWFLDILLHQNFLLPQKLLILMLQESILHELD
jgi:hypothetical protein